MGITYATAKVIGARKQSEVLEFLVDSGAQYTLLPGPVWKRLRLKPKRTESFRLVDGTRVERPISECVIEFAGKSGHTPVILGEPATISHCSASSRSRNSDCCCIPSIDS